MADAYVMLCYLAVGVHAHPVSTVIAHTSHISHVKPQQSNRIQQNSGSMWLVHPLNLTRNGKQLESRCCPLRNVRKIYTI